MARSPGLVRKPGSRKGDGLVIVSQPSSRPSYCVGTFCSSQYLSETCRLFNGDELMQKSFGAFEDPSQSLHCTRAGSMRMLVPCAVHYPTNHSHSGAMHFAFSEGHAAAIIGQGCLIVGHSAIQWEMAPYCSSQIRWPAPLRDLQPPHCASSPACTACSSSPFGHLSSLQLPLLCVLRIPFFFLPSWLPHLVF